MAIVLMICSALSITGALICKVKDLPSAVIFKVIPFFTGLAALLCAMDLLGWVHIG